MTECIFQLAGTSTRRSPKKGPKKARNQLPSQIPDMYIYSVSTNKQYQKLFSSFAARCGRERRPGLRAAMKFMCCRLLQHPEAPCLPAVSHRLLCNARSRHGVPAMFCFYALSSHMPSFRSSMDPPQQISDEQLEDIVLRGKVGTPLPSPHPPPTPP
jgi:hypothetical protein